MSHQPALQRRIANLEKMVQVSRALSSAFDLQSLLQEIVRSIVELADCEASSILLIDQQTGEMSFVAVCGSDLGKLKDVSVPRHGSIAGDIAETRQPLVVHRAQDDPRFFNHVDQVTGQSTTSLMGVPLEIGGRVIGVLQAVNKQADQDFDQEDVETLLIFASQAAAAIENTRLFEEQRQRLSEVLLLQEVLLTLSRFIRRDQLLEQLLILLEEWLGYTNCAVLLFDKERSALRVVESRGFPSQDADGHIVLVNEHSVSGRVALTHETVNIADIHNTDDLSPILANSRSALSVPMICGEDVDLVGVISLESEQAGFFTERDVRILTTIGTQAAIGVRQAELYEGSQRANRLKQEFITTMSHELRTPMTVLIGYCDMLAAKTLGPVNDAQVQALQVIRSRADLLLRMLNDILDFSKIASGELQVHVSRTNLVRAAQSAIEKYRPYAERKFQVIATDIPPTCQYIMADDQRLRQVLGHLIENAIKFSPERRPILVQASVYEGGYVRVDIIDQGIGIRPEDMDILFEDFRQLDSSFTRDYGGAGMGLAVSKHLIELQGGVIWVESRFGQGSTFSFVLPRPVSSDDQPV